MTRDIAERLIAAIENPAAEFQPDGTPKMANLVRDALAEIERLRAAQRAGVIEELAQCIKVHVPEETYRRFLTFRSAEVVHGSSLEQKSEG